MIGIIDYGLGNILAFSNIYKRLGITSKIIKTEEDFSGCSHLILPGVGSFDNAINLFSSSGLKERFFKEIDNGVFVLGICVGMQILADRSEEGNNPGLSLIPGVVKKFDMNRIQSGCRIPHMGWNSSNVLDNIPLFRNLANKNCEFYFLHSYYFEPEDPQYIIGKSVFGVEFVSAVKKDNIIGIQFHPEKSHSVGIALLENFSSI